MSTTTTGAPAANVYAEQALLGALLLGGAASVDIVAGRVGAADFSREGHGVIYDAMLKVSVGRGVLDIVTLSDELTRQDRLDAVGGLPYLMTLGDIVPVHADSTVEHYAAIVTGDALKRRVFWAARQIEAKAAEGGDAAEIAEYAELTMLAATEARRGAKAYRLAYEAIDAAMREVQAAMERGTGLSGIASGIDEWDRKTGGLGPGELHVVAGRPGMGKSVFAATVAVNIASQGYRVAVFSLEMRAEQIAKRMAAAAARINSGDIRNGKLTRAEFATLCEQVKRHLWELPMAFDDTPSISPGVILSRCRQMRRDLGGLDLVVVDYLQRLEPDGGRRNGTYAEEVNQIAKSLKTMAGVLGVPVLALAQPNRNCEKREDKRPILSDLADSSGIEKEASTVSMLYRPSYYERRDDTNAPPDEYEAAEVILAKQRDGETGTVQVLFSGPYQWFGNLAYREDGY